MECDAKPVGDFQNGWGVLLDFIPDVVILHDGDRILHANRAACRFFEVESPSRLVGHSFLDRVHPEDQDLVKIRISSVFHDGSSSLREYRVVDLNGGVKDVEAKAARTSYGGVICNFLIIRDITERKRQQRQLLELNDRLRRVQERQTQLTRHLISDGERQSATLAMELHDRIGQPLSSLKMNLERSLLKSRGLDGPTRAEIAECIEILKRNILDLKQMSSELLPSVIINLGLAHSLSSLRDHVAGKSRMRVHIFTSGLAGRYRGDIEVAVYRVIQEGLNNAVKHSGAANCFINLLDDGHTMSLSVEDDGNGFDMSAYSLADGGTFSLGLHIMRERIEQLGGEFAIDSSPGRGTSIVAAIPMDPDGRRPLERKA